jgi:hypothetical protein
MDMLEVGYVSSGIEQLQVKLIPVMTIQCQRRFTFRHVNSHAFRPRRDREAYPVIQTAGDLWKVVVVESELQLDPVAATLAQYRVDVVDEPLHLASDVDEHTVMLLAGLAGLISIAATYRGDVEGQLGRLFPGVPPRARQEAGPRGLFHV